MAKVDIRMTIEIDAKEWADTFGLDEWDAARDARELLAQIAAEPLKQHDQVKRIVTINGKMQPTI